MNLIKVTTGLMPLFFISLNCGFGLESLLSPAEVSFGNVDHRHLSQYSSQNETRIQWQSDRDGEYIVLIGQDIESACQGGRRSTGEFNAGTIKSKQQIASQIVVEDLALGENTVSICITSANGEFSQHDYTIYRDDTPPVTHKRHGAGAYTTMIEPELTCEDDFCHQIIYTTDGSLPLITDDGEVRNGYIYDGSIRIADETTTTIKYFGRDKAGNNEPIKTVHYSVDTVAAEIDGFMPRMVSNTNYTSSELTWRADKNNRLYYVYVNQDDCELSGNEVASGLSTGSYQSLDIDTTHLHVGTNDVRVCVESLYGFTKAESILRRDHSPPKVTVFPASGAFNQTMALTVSCEDNCDKVAYTADGSSPAFDGEGNITNGILYSAPFTPPVGTTTTYKFIGIDLAGNPSDEVVEEYEIISGIPNTSVLSVSNYYLSGLPSGIQSTDIEWSIEKLGLDYQTKVAFDCDTGFLADGTSATANINSTIFNFDLSEGDNDVFLCAANEDLSDFGFSTVNLFKDSAPPSVTSTSPVHTGTDIAPKGLEITVLFSEAMLGLTENELRNRVELFICIADCDGTATYRPLSLNEATFIQSNTNASNDTLTIIPHWPSLAELTQYQVVVHATDFADLAGNPPLSDYSFVFTTSILDARFPVTDTGVTTCFDDEDVILCNGTGQDGELIAVPSSRSFTEVTDTGEGDYIITDYVSGLKWTACVNGQDGEDCLGGAHQAVTWADAINTCQALNTNQYAGINNWRLPAAIELESLVDYSTFSPAISTGFPNTPAAETWTITTALSDSNRAWSVDFNFGGSTPLDKQDLAMVRCVSEPELVLPVYFVDNDDGTISDSVAGLTWQKCPMGQTYSAGSCNDTPDEVDWSDSLNSCNNLTLAGFDDWRLPNINELRSLILRDRINPAIDSSVFPAVTAPYLFWTSTTALSTPEIAWVVYLHDGTETIITKDHFLFTRCVR